MTAHLSPHVKALIAKARIVSFDGWQEQFGEAAIAALQTADDERRYLGEALLTTMPAGAVARHLGEHAATLVDQARAQVLGQFPDITQPGGGLYPPMRAEACWRDFWHFLRCITYGIAAQRTDYTDATGLAYMEQLYQELQVPLEAMVLGLQALKTASQQQLAELATSNAPIDPYFDRLIDALASFQPAD